MPLISITSHTFATQIVRGANHALYIFPALILITTLTFISIAILTTQFFSFITAITSHTAEPIVNVLFRTIRG